MGERERAPPGAQKCLWAQCRSQCTSENLKPQHVCLLAFLINRTLKNHAEHAYKTITHSRANYSMHHKETEADETHLGEVKIVWMYGKGTESLAPWFPMSSTLTLPPLWKHQQEKEITKQQESKKRESGKTSTIRSVCRESISSLNSQLQKPPLKQASHQVTGSIVFKLNTAVQGGHANTGEFVLTCNQSQFH